MDKFFIGLGISLILFGSFLVYQRNNPNRIAFAKSESEIIENKTKKLSDPIFINISSVGVHLPISFSEIKKNQWEVTDNGVSYLKSSVIPGEVGNSIMYGHNWTNLLGNLIKVKTGEKIEIIFKDGSKKEFIITLIQEIKSDDVSILNNTTDKRITIYTCSGFLDSKRFVVTAILAD